MEIIEVEWTRDEVPHHYLVYVHFFCLCFQSSIYDMQSRRLSAIRKSMSRSDQSIDVGRYHYLLLMRQSKISCALTSAVVCKYCLSFEWACAQAISLKCASRHGFTSQFLGLDSPRACSNTLHLNTISSPAEQLWHPCLLSILHTLF